MELPSRAVLLLVSYLSSVTYTEGYPWCPTNYVYHEGSCFRAFTAATFSWNLAEAACVWRGGHLASIGSQQEQDFVQGLHAGDMWIGYNDWQTANSFSWSNGFSGTFSNWQPGHPGDASRRCVAMRSSNAYNWTEADCTEALAYVCMVPLTYEGPFSLALSPSSNQQSGCPSLSCDNSGISSSKCLIVSLEAGANAVNYVNATECCALRCPNLSNINATASSPGKEVYAVTLRTSGSLQNASELFTKAADFASGQKSGCPPIHCQTVSDVDECAALTVTNMGNVFNLDVNLCCLLRCPALPDLLLETGAVGWDIYKVDTTKYGELNLLDLVPAPVFPTLIFPTLPPTPPPPTTTPRPPIELLPWYFQPLLLVLVAIGGAVLILFFCIFCLRACCAHTCPRCTERCDKCCDFECCECKCVGNTFYKVQECCCGDPKKKRRRRKRKKRAAAPAEEGQWWAYYPGVGWGPAPAGMTPGGAEVAGGGAAPPEMWDPGYDYGQNTQQATFTNEAYDPNYDGYVDQQPQQQGMMMMDGGYVTTSQPTGGQYA